jgi:hypothetical protein
VSAMNVVSAFLLGFSLFTSAVAATQNFYPPINENLAKTLDIDIPSLRSHLGIDLKAEKKWADRYSKVCVHVGVIPSNCSSEGKSLPEMKALADTGEPIFQNNYAHKLLLSVATPEARNESFDYMMRAAKQGLPHAQVTVGWRLLHGLNVERDTVSAFEWNLKGARQGHPEGAANVAFQYQYGIGIGKSYNDALAWYAYAAIRDSMVAYGALLQMKRDGY